LILALRREGVTGSDIGVIVAEVESHLEASGEKPEGAFGEPAGYARQRAHGSRHVVKRGPVLPDSPRWPLWGLEGTSLIELGMMLAAAAGSILVGTAAWALGSGHGSIGFLPAWLALILGLVLAGGPLLFLPDERIVDPRNGLTANLGGPTFRGLPLTVWIVPLVLAVGLGWFSNS
jgi:hypothetical protein